MSISAYPLQWPDHIERYKTAREAGKFKTSIEGALKNVRNSLQLFANDSGKNITGIVISSNYSLGINRPTDPGVAVWFTWDERQLCIPVDRYGSVEANLQAIHHILEARRVELRHGTLALIRATFRGFQALPAPGKADSQRWYNVLGFEHGAVLTETDIRERYRRLAKERADSEPALKELNVARDEALKAVR